MTVWKQSTQRVYKRMIDVSYTNIRIYHKLLSSPLHHPHQRKQQERLVINNNGIVYSMVKIVCADERRARNIPCLAPTFIHACQLRYCIMTIAHGSNAWRFIDRNFQLPKVNSNLEKFLGRFWPVFSALSRGKTNFAWVVHV